MTFLNPLVLLGMAAAAIPILLHLFNLRRLEKIDFSTLAFLKELQKTKIRRLKVRQLLLLFLRTLLILVLVTAFSRPTIRSSYVGGVRSQAKTTAVLIVDNSFSMTSLEGNGQLLRQAKEKATGLLQLMNEGDEVYLIRSADVSSFASATPSEGMRDFATVRSAIQNIEPSYVHGTIDDALRLAAKFLSSSKNINREVYILSDFKLGGLDDILAHRDPESIFPNGTRFFLLPFGKNTRQNIGIESLKIENALFSVGNPLTIKVKLDNYGTQNLKNGVISVFLNGTRVAQKAFDVQAQNSGETEFTLTPTSTGYLDGMVELQDDDLDFDNQRAFAVFIPDHLNILLVGKPDDLRYVKLALSAQPLQGESMIKLSTVSADRLSTNEIDAANVIVFCNPGELSAAQGMQLQSFVESGGGLMFFPGSQTDSTSFRSFWTTALNVPPILSVGVNRSTPNQPSSMIEFDRIDFRHPIFESMFEEETLKHPTSVSASAEELHHIESPSIHNHVQYQTNIQSIPIISLSDGSPFMLEQRMKKGVVLLFSVSATTDWSDFPLKGIFVPLLHSSASFAAQQRSILPQFTVGQEVNLNLRNVPSSKVEIQNPEKVDITVEVSNTRGESALRFPGASLPGIYTVKSGKSVLQQFVVTLDPRESNTVRADDKAIQSMFRSLGVSMNSVETIDQNADVQKVVTQSRVGIELWKYFIAAALLIGLIESVVARTSRKEVSPEGSVSGSSAKTI